MAFDNPDITLFAIVRYDHTAGQHRVVGVQNNPVRLFLDSSATGAWSIVSTVGALSPTDFRIEWLGVVDFIGDIALRFDQLVGQDADPFVNNETVVVNVAATGVGGTHALNVHLRAISGREFLEVGGQLALLGSGGVPATGHAAASAAPASGGTVVWGSIFWSEMTPSTLTFNPVNGNTTLIGGAAAGTYNVRIGSASPVTGGIGAYFDGNAMVTLPGGTTTAMLGDTDLVVVSSAGGPSVALGGLPTEIGVVPSATQTVGFNLTVTDPVYFSLQGVTITLDFVRRDGVAVASATYIHNASGALVQSAAPPAGVTVTLQQPVVANANRPPIDPAAGAWGGLYPGKAHSQTSATWGSGTPIDIEFDGRYEQVQVTVSATNHAGDATLESHTVYVAIPTDIVLSIDYSGSMSMDTLGNPGQTALEADSRWNAARGAANLFHALFKTISPALGGPTALTNQVGYVRFWWDDATATDQTAAVVGLTDVEGPPAAGALVADPWPPWLQFTPIASGVLTAYQELRASVNPGWRRRVIIAMTDGHENRGATIADIRTTSSADPNFIPNTSENAEEGITIHSCAFGPAGSVADDKMEWLATGSDGGKGFGGNFHATSTSVPADASKALTSAYLSMLVDSLAPSVNRVGPVDANSSITISSGNNQAILFITSDAYGAVTLNGPGVSSMVPTGSAAGVVWWTLPTPANGSYSVSYPGAPPAAGTVDLHAIEDLQLRASFSVGGSGAVGATLTLHAHITDAGKPVSGADVRANASGPGLSEGTLLYQAAKVRKRRSVSAIKDYIRSPDVQNVRGALLLAATNEFSIAKAFSIATTGGIKLNEVAGKPGHYEATFKATANEGSYSFAFSANGVMLQGAAFSRSYTVSRYIHAVADPALTDVVWTPGVLKGNLLQWTLSVVPTTFTGAPTGGGRSYAVEVAGSKEPVVLEDRLDGSYVATIALDPLAPPPAVTLIDGNRRVPLQALPPDRSIKRVRVVLERVQIKEAHESFGDPGEIHFDAVVAPNGDRSQAVRRRIPEKGVLKLRDGDTADAKALLYEGFVEEGSRLMIAIGASEHDVFPSGAERTEMMATYRRTLTGPIANWAGRYVPGDEKREDEELADWRLWYRIDVL